MGGGRRRRVGGGGSGAGGVGGGEIGGECVSMYDFVGDDWIRQNIRRRLC